MFPIHCSCTYENAPNFSSTRVSWVFFHHRFQPSPENQKAAGPAMSRGSFRKIGTIPWPWWCTYDLPEPKKIGCLMLFVLVLSHGSMVEIHGPVSCWIRFHGRGHEIVVRDMSQPPSLVAEGRTWKQDDKLSTRTTTKGFPADLLYLPQGQIWNFNRHNMAEQTASDHHLSNLFLNTIWISEWKLADHVILNGESCRAAQSGGSQRVFIDALCANGPVFEAFNHFSQRFQNLPPCLNGSGEDQISNLHEFDLAKRHLVLQWRYADGGGGV